MEQDNAGGAMLVDSHFHVWRRQDLPWLSGPMAPRIFGPYEPIRRDYAIEEYKADAESASIAKAVYVQPNWPIERAVDEVRWVEELAQRTGWPHAIVGTANLMDDSCVDVMREQSRLSARMRGCRLQLHWHDNPQFRYAPAPDQMNGPAFRRNLAHLQDFGWLFELQVFSGQMKDAAGLVRDFPGIPFVLVHAGMLEDGAPETREKWREGMRRLADRPNLVVKMSGQGTFVHRVDQTLISDVLGECLEMFGSERCMFGSNFPIEKLWTDYRALHAAYVGALAGHSENARRNVLGATAARVYSI